MAPHPRVRRRAQALVRLEQGVTQTQVAREFGVHWNSVRPWMNRWRNSGLAGLHPAPVPGRPRKLSPVATERLRQVALTQGGTVRHIMQCMEERQMPLLVEPATVNRWLKEMGFSYKRYRSSLKKTGCQSGGALCPATGPAETAGTGRNAGTVLF